MAAPKPALPRNPANPVGDAKILTRTRKDIQRTMRAISREVLAIYDSVPRSFVDVQANYGRYQINQRIYTYETNPILLQRLPIEIQAIIDRWLLEDGIPSWYMYSAVEQSSTAGMAEGVVSFQNLSPQYARTVEQVLLSPPFQNRLEVVRSRTFNSMQGLSVEMKSDLNRILVDGMSNGFGPRKIAQQIHQQIGLPEWNDGKNKASYARALRIARTETNNAHRQARWATADDARENFGIQTKLMHLSALSPTTRRTHARRHGKLFNSQEVKEWYSVDGNSVNCKCSQVEMLVDDDGKPLDPAFVKKTQKRGKKFFNAGGGTD